MTTTSSPAPTYALGATARCLRSDGLRVSKIDASNRRLKALGDLAQRTSIEAHAARGVVGLAFAKSRGDAELLAELLRQPDHTYRILLRRNVVLLARRTDGAAVARVVRCLRS